MRYFRPIKTIQKTKVLEEKEISKGALGFVTRNSNATIFTFVMAVLKQVQNDNNRALLLSTLVMAGLVRHRVLKQVQQNDKKHFTITKYSSQMPSPIAAYAAMTILL